MFRRSLRIVYRETVSERFPAVILLPLLHELVERLPVHVAEYLRLDDPLQVVERPLGLGPA